MARSRRNNIDMSEEDFLDGMLNGTIQFITVDPSSTPATTAAEPAKIPIAKIPWECRGTQTTIRHDLVLAGEPLGIDVEFQNYKLPGEKFKHRIGCIAIVNTAGEVVFHAYFAYGNVPGVQKRYPGADFMVEAPDFLFQNGALQARKAEKAVKELVRGREIVLHDKTHDQTCFFYETDALKPSNGVTIVDTQQMYSHLAPNGRPSLSHAYSSMFDDTIQNGPHSPVEDAQAAMKLRQLKNPYDRIAEAAKLTAARAPHAARKFGNRPQPFAQPRSNPSSRSSNPKAK